MTMIQYYYDNPIDPKLITDTFKAAYGIEMDYTVFEWRFLNNPVISKIYINYIMIEGVLASYYALSPVVVTIDGIIHKMALSCMTMTHPDHQGKGYFKMLAKDLYSKLAEDGFIGVFGFANQNSHYGFRKNLGWVDLCPLNLFSLEKKRHKNYLNKSYNEYAYSDSELSKSKIEDSKSLKFSDRKITPERSRIILSWRLLNNPTYKYFALEISIDKELKGIIFYKFYSGAIDLMEVFYNGVYKLDILLNGITYLLDKYDCNINIWSNLHSEEHLALEKAGFKESQFLTYFGVIPFSSNTEITNLNNWHYRFIDSDVF